MKGSGTYAPDDLISAVWVHLRPRRSLAILGSLLLALCLAGDAVMLFNANEFGLGWTRWAVPGALLYLALFFGIGIPYRCRRTYQQRKDLQRPCAFLAEDQGLQFSTSDASGIKAWSDYVKWKEGKHCFLLYMSDRLYQVIPKRFLGSEEAVSEFREIVRRKVAREVA